ncbi:MAG: septum formation initiator family protein [Eubacterium sp.]|nr:septum formation initiator family protein [Eubacterium sp.]
MARNNPNLNRPNRENAVKNLSAEGKRRRSNRTMVISITIIMVVFLGIMGVQIFQKLGVLNKLKSQEAQLRDEYKKELQISKELKEKKKFVQTDEYVEDMARKLGLLYPDEVILQPEK